MKDNDKTKPEKRLPEGAAVAFGFFDGLHRGHQRLMDHLLAVAREKRYTSMVYTFSNHPLSVLGRGHPAMLFTPEEKWRALCEYGAEHVCMVPFTKELSQTTYDRFLENLMRTIPVKEIVIGFNYKMGRGAQGTPDKLAALGRVRGFTVHVVEPEMYNDLPISSTRIRDCVQAGNLEDARKMLGRPYSVCGKVGRGRRLGSDLGFPTANVAFAPDKAIVPGGVYATRTVVDGRSYPSVTNVGVCPTVVGRAEVGIETHLLDFAGNIYEKTVEVQFLDRLRDERTFGSIEELGAQIGRDAKKAAKPLAPNDGC